MITRRENVAITHYLLSLPSDMEPLTISEWAARFQGVLDWEKEPTYSQVRGVLRDNDYEHKVLKRGRGVRAAQASRVQFLARVLHKLITDEAIGAEEVAAVHAMRSNKKLDKFSLTND